MVRLAAFDARIRAGGQRRWTTTAALLASAGVLLPVVVASDAHAAPSRTVVAARLAEDASSDAARARGRVAERKAQIAASTARLDQLSAAAGVALEQYQQAQRARVEAQMAQLQQISELSGSRQALGTARSNLGTWARQAYESGGHVGELSAALELLRGGSPADVGHDLATFRAVTVGKAAVVDAAGAAADLRRQQVAQAEAAAAAALVAVAAADRAKSHSDALLADQRAEQQILHDLLFDEQEAAAEAARRERALAKAKAQAEARRKASLREPSPLVLQSFNATTGCQGADVSRWPNGQIPAQALCPLWGQPGHLLRADAAAAFERLSQAWAADHGEPICVTDSYRPLAIQVRLAVTKPTLAARPGTSNHGWGIALDLCGGVQTFGTPAHEWMLRNGPQFGWFHPTWAGPGGSRPEAWHWEFAG